ncbi:hypothetical protein B0O80DRAFT_446009 [Mortierella sp. GBAus27b]|nr:hypothetical protein B0O80DRAFT_446009 [Mortierella sp. GBAus27b]
MPWTTLSTLSTLDRLIPGQLATPALSMSTPPLTIPTTLQPGDPAGLAPVVDVFPQSNNDPTRPTLPLALLANWLSVAGSLAIILHVPTVIARVPSQRKRMFIILFTAISNFCFSLVNIITDYADATTYLPCSLSAWCYVFFQLLTCTLVIASTFRLCGVFLFTDKRSIPSKYIAICPLIAFILATTPAAFKQYDFNECSHYCWFKPTPAQEDCRIISLWAWLCFYGWMILFLSILFGSTLFVLGKIAVAVTHSRSDLKQVANQSLNSLSGDLTTRSTTSPTVVERLRSLGRRIQGKTASTHSSDIQHKRNDNQQDNLHMSTGSEDTAPGLLSDDTANSRPGDNYSPTRVHLHSGTTGSFSNGRDTSSSQRTSSHSSERAFMLAIFRQAFYPISISISGCVQIIVDVTLVNAWDYEGSLDYAANIVTSVQGFLFFLVFMFDPAVVQTRRYWRKYLIWKYYIEFYYSFGMPHEGREFEDRFMEKCQALNRPGNEAQFDLLAKPPPYSWSLQYDDLAMPSDFQTAYPLAAMSSTLNTSQPLSNLMTSQHQVRQPPSQMDDNINNTTAIGAKRAEYTPPSADPFPDSTLRFHDNEDTMNQPMTRTDTRGDPAATELKLEPGTFKDWPFESETLEHDQSDTQTSRSRQLSSTIALSHEDNVSHTMTHQASRSRSHDTDQGHNIRPNPRGRDWQEFSDSDLEDIDSFNDDLDENLDIERTPRRKITLMATQPGDVLSFPKLSRVETIGGGNVNGRRYRPKRTQRFKSAFGQNTLGSRDNGVTGSRPLVDRLRQLIKPRRRDADSIMCRYQTQFRYPRFAYLMHRIVRIVYIPREARLPPILNPFEKRFKPDVVSRANEPGPSRQGMRAMQMEGSPAGQQPGEAQEENVVER